MVPLERTPCGEAVDSVSQAWTGGGRVQGCLVEAHGQVLYSMVGGRAGGHVSRMRLGGGRG